VIKYVSLYFGAEMRFRRGKVGVIESFLSIFLLAVLAIIAIAVFFKQFRYNPADFAMAGDTSHAAVAVNKSSNLELAAPQGYAASPKVETFDADSLYNKIDGKADLYLESGFKQLDCRVFTSSNDPNLWMEVFAYDMGTPKNALAVFGVQKRPEGIDVGLADFAYKTPDAVFLAKGKYYVEITGSAVSEPLAGAMETLGTAFVKSVGSAAGEIEELAAFPKENLVPQSFKLYRSGAYGYDGFKDLYSAKYDINGSQTTAFLCKLPDNVAAEKFAAEYRKFLTDNGGTAKTAVNETLKNDVFDMAGEIEVVFEKGAFVGGVHGAETQQTAEIVAAKILKNLTTENTEIKNK
jgi:hypothetical protein